MTLRIRWEMPISSLLVLCVLREGKNQHWGNQ